MSHRHAGVTHQRLKFVASAAAHVVATSICFIVFVGLFMNGHLISLLEIGARDPQMRPDVMESFAILYGLSACTWALVFVVIGRVKLGLTAPRRVLGAARGTIIAETLIVMPIFFLLTFGLAQMAINSIGGLLTTLASYEVARSLAVWAPEEGNRATRPQIRSKARLVAAGVVAPVVPELRSGLCDAGSNVAAMREGLTGTGLSSTATGDAMKWSFVDALGTGRFADRGPTKLTLAYCNIDVEWTGPLTTDTDSTRTSAVNARVIYHHPIAFPLVGAVFTTNYGGGLWATNYVATFDKSYMLFSYLTPNIHRPYSDPNLPWDFIP